MRKKKQIGKSVFLYLVGFLCIFPAIVLFLRSFMSPQELLEEFHLIPQRFTLQNYDKLLLTTPEYYGHFWKSLLYAASTIVFGLPVSLLAGFAFARRKFCGKHTLFIVYVVIMLMPFQATLVPQYLMLNRMQLLDTIYAIILPNIFATFGTILMAQYMEGIDESLYEAGKLDGLGEYSIFFRLILPICRPIILSYLVLTFIDVWAMIEQPMIFLKNSNLYPLALELKNLEMSQLLPGSVIFSILPFLVYRISRNSLVEGIQMGSLK